MQPVVSEAVVGPSGRGTIKVRPYAARHVTVATPKIRQQPEDPCESGGKNLQISDSSGQILLNDTLLELTTI